MGYEILLFLALVNGGERVVQFFHLKYVYIFVLIHLFFSLSFYFESFLLESMASRPLEKVFTVTSCRLLPVSEGIPMCQT